MPRTEAAMMATATLRTIGLASEETMFETAQLGVYHLQLGFRANWRTTIYEDCNAARH